jgi:SAM-dependent methyltransferase
VVDCGCGDWQFSRFIDWGQARYAGFDIVASVIAANTKAFAEPPRITFSLYDGQFANLPEGDLLICKDVLQHLSERRIYEFIDAIRGRYRHCLITNCVLPDAQCNRSIEDGSFRPLDLRRPPFDLRLAAVHSFSGALPQSGAMWKKIVLLASPPPSERD